MNDIATGLVKITSVGHKLCLNVIFLLFQSKFISTKKVLHSL